MGEPHVTPVLDTALRRERFHSDGAHVDLTVAPEPHVCWGCSAQAGASELREKGISLRRGARPMFWSVSHSATHTMQGS